MEPNVIIIIGFLSILMILEGLLVLYIFIKYRQLTRKVKKGNLITLIENIISTEEKNSKKIKEMLGELKRVEEEGKYNIQKVGLVRYNPFEEVGGDHSFSVALLDGTNTGFIVSGLHTRERTRIYMKEVRGGNLKIDLSKEEKKALEKALGKE